MSEKRRATVMLIQRGDPEIGGALMEGMIAGRAEAIGKGDAQGAHPDRETPVESVEIVTVEQDKWRRVARQVRIAVGNNRTAEDYCQLIVKARGDYAVHAHPGPLHTVAGKLLLAWALIWQGIWRAYDAQDRVLRP